MKWTDIFRRGLSVLFIGLGVISLLVGPLLVGYFSWLWIEGGSFFAFLLWFCFVMPLAVMLGGMPGWVLFGVGSAIAPD